jgi:thiazolinyl reductase component of yersiniabactin synthetase
VLRALGAHLDGGDIPAAFGHAYQLAPARLWQKTLQCAGPTCERPIAPPPALDSRVFADPALPLQREAV